jgi:hypothetical protein
MLHERMSESHARVACKTVTSDKWRVTGERVKDKFKDEDLVLTCHPSLVTCHSLWFSAILSVFN